MAVTKFGAFLQPSSIGVPVSNDFSSDVGRKRFGFSHEELDDSSAYYEGQFKHFQRDGEGTLHNPETGSKYVGQFQADHYHGDGDQTWSDGSKYVGQWKNGQKNGSGIYVGVDNLKYIGQWEDGRRHGRGMQEYLNGDRYEGFWYNGLCSGTGTYFFNDGTRYEGVWANGRYDGNGTLYAIDGHRERQQYSRGLLMKREMIPPSAVPKSPRKSTRGLYNNKVTSSQTRDAMHKPAMLPRPQPSKYLIRRETTGKDLSAPALRPKTAQTQLAIGGLENTDTRPPIGREHLGGLDDRELRPSTGKGDSVLMLVSERRLWDCP